jgi:cysteine-S-conjugate beta-lyase
MGSSNDGPSNPQKAETRLVTVGRDTKGQRGFVNPAVFHGSTVLYPTAEDLHAHRAEFSYGRHGSPTTRALQDVLMALEGPQCAGVGLAPSGLAAITTTLLSVLGAGDHVLVTDNVYRPSRNFCNGVLARYGVEVSYFDPLIGAGIESLFKPNTKAVLVEALGSQSFEMSDIPAIAEVAHARARSSSTTTPGRRRYFIVRSTRASTSACRPPPNISAAIPTSCSARFRRTRKPGRWLAEGIRLLGVCAGPDDVFLALRGTRTLSVRLAQHYRSGLEMARWLASRREVLSVLHPALESHPGHAIWQRDFTGASGLFSIVLKPVPQKAVDALLDTVKLFGMGFSWGGFESLIIPFDCDQYRSATKWSPGGPTLRLHIGLENVDDLKADLDRGFSALKAAA